MSNPAPAKRSTSPEYDWQKQRLKIPGKAAPPGCGLVRGYGPRGEYSMYLPTPRDKRLLQFRGGKPTVIAESSPLETEEIRLAREAVFKSAALRDAPTVADFLEALQGDVVLAAYSAALLALNYNLNDEDLTLLHSGRQWIDPVLQHAMGGKEAVETLRRISPETLTRMVAESEGQLTRSVIAAQTATVRPPATSADAVEAVAALVAKGEYLTDDELDLAMD